MLVVAAITLLVAITRVIFLHTTLDKRLLKACLGNRDQAERLIEYELRRNPGLSRQRTAALALARIRRDNH